MAIYDIGDISPALPFEEAYSRYFNSISSPLSPLLRQLHFARTVLFLFPPFLLHHASYIVYVRFFSFIILTLPHLIVSHLRYHQLAVFEFEFEFEFEFD